MKNAWGVGVGSLDETFRYSLLYFICSGQEEEIFHVEAVKNYRSHVPSKDGGVGKSTLFQSTHLLLGLNCLEPGIEQRVHTHEGQDKFYHVLEGCGEFTVGDAIREAGVGYTVWAPAGVLHGVRNRGEERLVLLVGMAPSP